MDLKLLQVQRWQEMTLLLVAVPGWSGLKREEQGVSGNFCLEEPEELGVLGVHCLVALVDVL